MPRGAAEKPVGGASRGCPFFCFVFFGQAKKKYKLQVTNYTWNADFIDFQTWIITIINKHSTINASTISTDIQPLPGCVFSDGYSISINMQPLRGCTGNELHNFNLINKV